MVPENILISKNMCRLLFSTQKRHTMDAEGKLEHVRGSQVDQQRWMGAVVRSIVANMSKLAQLLLILITWRRRDGKLTEVKERLARVVR